MSGGSGGGHGGSGGRGSGLTPVGTGYDSLYTPSMSGSPGGFGSLNGRCIILYDYFSYYFTAVIAPLF